MSAETAGESGLRERKRSPIGTLVVLDITPSFALDAFKYQLFADITEKIGPFPYWTNPSPRGLTPYHTPALDIHKAHAQWCEQYYHARLFHSHPEIDILSGGPLSEIAWVRFWAASKMIDVDFATTMEKVLLSHVEGRIDVPVPEITCAVIMSPEEVRNTWIDKSPIAQIPGWIVNAEGAITTWNECLRSAIYDYGDLFPKLLVLDSENGNSDIIDQLRGTSQFVTDHLKLLLLQKGKPREQTVMEI